MEVNQNNIIKERLIKIISQKNFIFFIFLTALLIASLNLFYSVRDLVGLLPVLVSMSVLLSFILFKNSKKLFSIKLLSSVILINVSFFVTLGGINYDSSSFFSFDYSLSGKYGEFLAKEPYYWNQYNASITNYIDFIFRLSTPLIIISIIYYPHFYLRILSNLYSILVSFIISFTYLLRKNLLTFFKKKIIGSRIKDTKIREVNIDDPKIENTKIREINIDDPKIEDTKIEEDKLFSRDISTEIKKEIIYDDRPNIDKELDRFSIREFNWPKIKTNFLKLTPKKELDKNEINDTIEIIKSTLSAHGVNTSIENFTSGPSVTMYQLKPGWMDDKENKRVKVEQVLRREKDLALALGSPNIRFEAVLDGVQNIMGIEIPNISPNTVDFKEVIEDERIKNISQSFSLPAPLGQGMDGKPIMIDIAKMPHLLVAGSTGSGKSVFINSIIAGMITTKTPEEVRMILIDPKRVELTPYGKIPHLYTEEVIVDTDKAVEVLSSTVTEMMNRFKILEKVGVKNISDFNKKMGKSHKMWNLLIVIDELADLMLQAGSEIERLIVRLAQLGRATGIHLVVATQRPSVDVVTGLIKANFPSRVSFAVMSQIDSRTVLDSIGAEKLIGKGDMLFSPIDNAQMSRIQGVFLNEDDIEALTNQWNSYYDKYELEMLKLQLEGKNNNKEIKGDSLYDQALELSSQSSTLSTSLLQRRLRIGYPRAARLMDELEDNGIVGPGEAGKPRKILV
ncbi:MAG: DNA translocase FtsK [Dehalococcoidia bacterium]|nr:DNA translocase FtsK [Dehalococcoidia bacterium]